MDYLSYQKNKKGFEIRTEMFLSSKTGSSIAKQQMEDTKIYSLPLACDPSP